MKEQALTVIEHHPAQGTPRNQIIYQTVTAWLTKELRK